jgi:hypothetical protein
MINTFMTTSANDFFNDIDYKSIISTIEGIYTSDASISTLMDFERVLDEADLYAFKNWDLGELVDGPQISKYTVACIFMYPLKLMPNPKGGKRLTNLGCNVHFKKTEIKVPVKIEGPMDYKPGTHYPKMMKRHVWLVRIEIPKELMNDIREGSIDLAGQTVDLEELDSAYEKDYDKESEQGGEPSGYQGQMAQQPPAGTGLGGAPGMMPSGGVMQ